MTDVITKKRNLAKKLIDLIDKNLDEFPEEVKGDIIRLRAQIEIKLKNNN